MGIAAALGVASLAMGVAGSASSASASKSAAQAQYMQQEINRKWQEFDKEMELTRQRGVMGLKEFDRLFANALIERESLETYVNSKEALTRQQQYQFMQVYRQQQTMRRKQQMSMASRGMGRGGTADAIAAQTEADFQSDMVRMRNNNQASLGALKNQRNQALRQRNMRPTDQPPTYIPSTPIPPPNTAAMDGAILGAVAQGLGGLAGVAAGGGFNFGGGGSTAMPVGAQSVGSLGAGGMGVNPSTGGFGINTPGGFMTLGFGGG